MAREMYIALAIFQCVQLAMGRAAGLSVNSRRGRASREMHARSQTRIARTRSRETYVGGQVATCLAGRPTRWLE